MTQLRTIPAALARALRDYPDLEAFVDGDVRLTYREYVEQIRIASAAYLASGLEPGDRVAVWAPNSHRWPIAALGAVAAGGVLVPVNTRYKGEEARWIIAKSRARMLMVDNDFLAGNYLGLLRDAVLESGESEAGGGPVPGLPSLVDVVVFGDAPDESVLSWSQFLDRAASVPRAQVLARAEAVTETDYSDMCFTSGTTGRPKGALTNHAQNLRVYESYIEALGLRTGDRYLLVNPMFHAFGYKAGVLASIIQGMTLIPQATFDAHRSLELIAAERITVVPGPPTLYSSMLEDPLRGELDLSSLRLAMTGAASVPVALVERMRAELFPTVLIAYGLTETCGTATVGDRSASVETIARTVGRPIPGTEVRIAGPDSLPLPAGESGEVLVRGYNVMQGYFEDPEATASAIDEDGWLHTGDVGLFEADGNLRITDRLKDMFVVGGFNTYPAEVEQLLAHHPKVAEAAVIGVPDERLGEVGRAYVLARRGVELTEAEIIDYCRERLANFKVPRSVVLVEELPRNASGKVLKFKLRQQSEDQAEVNARVK
jgi:acyl-CoA synthetase (AMP-forming)/AMP-acid ligase II